MASSSYRPQASRLYARKALPRKPMRIEVDLREKKRDAMQLVCKKIEWTGELSLSPKLIKKVEKTYLSPDASSKTEITNR